MDQRIIELFDDYTHRGMTRRAFLDRLATLAGGAAAATALLPLLENNYAAAQVMPEADPRIVTQTISIAGIDKLTGYLVKPNRGERWPAVIVIHENRGLNAHIRDIARRLGTEGFLALAPDYLSPIGGTPADEDRARELIGSLKPQDALAISRATLIYLKRQPDIGRVGAVGFCWGGGQVNALAVAEPMLDAGIAYYGRQPPADAVAGIKAALLLHYAEMDPGINAGIPAFEAALKGAGKTYELHMYPGVNHAFNNDTNAARYNKEAADLAWSRTLTFLRKHLGDGSQRS
jgi:carboxymethylenebutenolidase